MTVFLSSYTNGVDKKGRVSVPASFRGEMINHSRQQVVVYAAPNEGFLYAWSYDDFVIFANKIKKLPPMSKQRQRLSRTILAAARPLNFDADGRVVLPEELKIKAGISDKAVLAGEGEYFTIWNPDVYESKMNDDLAHYEDDMEMFSENWDAE